MFDTYKSWANYVKKYMANTIVQKSELQLVLNDGNGTIAVWDNIGDKGHAFVSKETSKADEALVSAILNSNTL